MTATMRARWRISALRTEVFLLPLLLGGAAVHRCDKATVLNPGVSR
jgi:hypothetical protein